jgi:CRISPR-associated protein Cas5t
MLGLCLSVPIASFRRGAAREFWETYPTAPPATVYGSLLAMVGESDRYRHVGVRCTSGLLRPPYRGQTLRRLWRVKDKKVGLGNGVNVRPDFQQLLVNLYMIIWVDSAEESGRDESLEERVRMALDPKRRAQVNRFGGWSLGESTHLIDEVLPIDRAAEWTDTPDDATAFLVEPTGNLSLPVWVDHVGSAGTQNALGRLTRCGLSPPPNDRLPQIPFVAPPLQ